MLAVGTVAEASAKREAAGKEVIAMRDQSAKEGFEETPEFQENWNNIMLEYL